MDIEKVWQCELIGCYLRDKGIIEFIYPIGNSSLDPEVSGRKTD
jgi:hypothetical protein